MKIGFTELLLIFIVALFALGPDKLPAFARKLGEALGQFRKYSEEATREIKESVIEPLEEVQKPIREAVEPLAETEKAVCANVKDLQDSVAGISKTQPKSVSVPDKPSAREGADKPTSAAEQPLEYEAEVSAETEREGAEDVSAASDMCVDANAEAVNLHEEKEEFAV